MNSTKPKLIRAANVSGSLDTFCKGMLAKLSEEYEVIALASPDERLEMVGRREGVRTAGILIERKPAIRQDIRTLIELIRFFKKEKPAIVHSMSAKCGLLCMMAAKFAGVPHRVHSFTGLAFPTASGLKRIILKTTERITCICGNHLLPEGQGVKNDLIDNHITKKPLRIIGNGNIRGIDLDYYCRSDKVMSAAAGMADKNLFTFVFVGRIVVDKGINELVEAMTRIHKINDAVRLVLIGDNDGGVDPVKPETIRAIQESSFIEAVGRQSDVRPYLAAADCFVLPSYREGFPNSVIEAGAMGLPSIVSDINGANEIIISGQNGLVVPSKDVDALYKAMIKMIEDKDSRLFMASNARKMVADRYELNYVQKCYIDFYREILS